MKSQAGAADAGVAQEAPEGDDGRDAAPGGGADHGARWRVDKTMLPGSRGAIKLGRRYGSALVCVRYRLSADGRERITTVELVVGRAPVARRSEALVPLHLYRWDIGLTRRVKEHGARFDARSRTWFLPKSIVSRLGIEDRIAVDHEDNVQEQVPRRGT